MVFADEHPLDAIQVSGNLYEPVACDWRSRFLEQRCSPCLQFLGEGVDGPRDALVALCLSAVLMRLDAPFTSAATGAG